MNDKKQSTHSNNTLTGIIILIIVVVGGLVYWQSSSKKSLYTQPEAERPFLGNKDAKIVLQEYSDFACPACGRVEPEIKKWLEKYGDKIKFEYNHFPLRQLHSNAFSAAVASECANDQGKFWAYHDKLFNINNNASFTAENLKQYAQEIGVDLVMWQNCLDSGVREAVVKRDTGEGMALNVNSTPSFAINGSLLKWNNFSDVDRIIEMELTALEKTTP